MKLSPPASSSDLEVAREVARRLHEQRRQAERRPAAVSPMVVRRPAAPAAATARLDVMPSGPGAPQRHQNAAPERPGRPTHVAPAHPLTPPPVVAPPVVTPPVVAPPVVAPPVVAPPVVAPPVVAPPVVAPPIVAPPVVAAAAPPRPTPAPSAHAPHALEPPARPAAPALAPEPLPLAAPAPEPWDSEGDEAPETEETDALSALGDVGPVSDAEEDAPPSEDDAIEIEETNTTLEEMVSAAGTSAEEIVGPPDLDAGEAPVDEGESYEPAPAAAFTTTPSPFDSSIETMSEELFDLPATPSWDEVVENCLMIAHARGAMLIDPAGQVLASNGFWPEPGPEPIATKLVAMMEKTLKDAPTRSVSAPVGAMHLTAWRVPLAEGLITVAFLGDAPLRAEARMPVDAEILRGAP